MEDGVSTILYIIISAIILLVGALGRRKKLKQIPVDKGTGESGANDFFDKLGLSDKDEEEEEFIDYSREEETENDESEKQVGITITPTFEEELDQAPVVADSIYAEKEEITEEEEEKKISEYDYNKESEIEDSIDEVMEEFNLKKAIIYSEIINSRY